MDSRVKMVHPSIHLTSSDLGTSQYPLDLIHSFFQDSPGWLLAAPYSLALTLRCRQVAPPLGVFPFPKHYWEEQHERVSPTSSEESNELFFQLMNNEICPICLAKISLRHPEESSLDQFSGILSCFYP